MSTIAFLGVTTLLITQAASWSISLQPEDGSLSGNVSITNDNTASDDQAVRFGNASSSSVLPKVKSGQTLIASEMGYFWDGCGGSCFNLLNQARDIPSIAQFWNDNYDFAYVFPPYFNEGKNAKNWYFNPTMGYLDISVLYNDSRDSDKPGDWFLKDSNGNKIFLNWGCGGGSCPQYVADIGNQGFRQYVKDRITEYINWEHEGVMLDDVNFYIWNHVYGNGQQAQAINPRTGQNLTETEWNEYMATLVEEIEDTHPDLLISTNTHYFQIDYSNSYHQRSLASTDIHLMEIGFLDPNLNRGSYESLYGFSDFAHNKGAVVYYMDNGSGADIGNDHKKAESFLANYFMVNEGGDFISTQDRQNTPQNYWSGWDIDLGNALGLRSNNDGIYTRVFEKGKVIVNEPDAPTRTVSLGGNYKNMNGQTVNSVTLNQQSGAVFLNL